MQPPHRAFVTFCESNAKALLTAEPSKGAVALSEGQRAAFEKALSALSAKLRVGIHGKADLPASDVFL